VEAMSTQLSLLDIVPPPLPVAAFDGETFEPKHDQARLSKQLLIVYTLMCDQEWYTLGEISDRTWFQEQSVSARIRDMRKTKFGAHTVERRRRGDAKRGIFEYRLLVREQ
jgi:hypothetical protein